MRESGIPIQLERLPQLFAEYRIVKKHLPMSLSDTEKSVDPDVLYAGNFAAGRSASSRRTRAPR